MNARYYVSGIGRFASADSIIPDPSNPQSYNRYGYVRNNPLKFTDPTGHSECGVGQYHCEDDPIPFEAPMEVPNSDFELMKMLFEALGQGAIMEAFKLGFGQDLPKELITHYVSGHGQTFYLSSNDMLELGVELDLRKSQEFLDIVRELAGSGSTSSNISFDIFEHATSHGTLGQFTAYYEGMLEISIEESGVVNWSFDGYVKFRDVWDFDKRNRGWYGELTTGMGRYLLPGDSFEILSVYTPVEQTNTSSANWAGSGLIGSNSRLADELIITGGG